jgi:hypothetical protein
MIHRGRCKTSSRQPVQGRNRRKAQFKETLNNSHRHSEHGDKYLIINVMDLSLSPGMARAQNFLNKLNEHSEPVFNPDIS